MKKKNKQLTFEVETLKSIHWVNCSVRSSLFEKGIIHTKPFQPSQSGHQLSFFEKGIIVQNFLLQWMRFSKNMKHPIPLSIRTWFLTFSSLKYPIWWSGFFFLFKLDKQKFVATIGFPEGLENTPFLTFNGFVVNTH